MVKKIKNALEWLMEKDPITDDPIKTQITAFKSGALQAYAREFVLGNLEKIGYNVKYSSSKEYLPLLCKTVEIKDKKRNKLKEELIQEVLSQFSAEENSSYCFFLAIAQDYYFDKKKVFVERNNNFLIQTLFLSPPKQILNEYHADEIFDSFGELSTVIREEIEDLILSSKPSKNNLYQPIFQIFVLKYETGSNVVRPDFKNKRR